MDPERIPRWWGPHGTTTTVVEMDVRVGGKWRYISHAPGPRRRVVPRRVPRDRATRALHLDIPVRGPGLGDQGGPETFTFEDIDGKTTVTSTSHFSSTDEIDGALASGMIKGAVETWDRFAAMLAEG